MLEYWVGQIQLQQLPGSQGSPENLKRNAETLKGLVTELQGYVETALIGAGRHTKPEMEAAQTALANHFQMAEAILARASTASPLPQPLAPVRPASPPSAFTPRTPAALPASSAAAAEPARDPRVVAMQAVSAQSQRMLEARKRRSLYETTRHQSLGFWATDPRQKRIQDSQLPADLEITTLNDAVEQLESQLISPSTRAVWEQNFQKEKIIPLLRQRKYAEAARLASTVTAPASLEMRYTNIIHAVWNVKQDVNVMMQFINDHLLVNQQMVACSILFPLLTLDQLLVAKEFIQQRWFETNSAIPDMAPIDKEYLLKEWAYAYRHFVDDVPTFLQR